MLKLNIVVLVRRELLSVLGALRYWKHLVLGSSVRLRTDHASLILLENFKIPGNKKRTTLNKLT
jgi:hypothetical protein